MKEFLVLLRTNISRNIIAVRVLAETIEEATKHAAEYWQYEALAVSHMPPAPTPTTRASSRGETLKEVATVTVKTTKLSVEENLKGIA